MMSDIPVHVLKRRGFTIERDKTNTQGTIFRFSGPLTEQSVYSTMSPDSFRDVLESVPEFGQPPVHIFDLTEVPYMDSRSLGMLVRHHVRCQGRGIRLKITGISPRVRELFRITKIERVLSIAEIEKANRD